MYHKCHYCLSEEHSDTNGVKSVDPQLEGLWFCSSNCLCMYKKNGFKAMVKKKKVRAEVQTQ